MSKLKEYKEILSSFTHLQEVNTWMKNISQGTTIVNGTSLRVKENHVRGCCPNCLVWADVDNSHDALTFRLDSDNDTIKGLCTILMDVYNGLSKEEVLDIKYKDFEFLSRTLKTDKQKSLQYLINRIHKLVHQPLLTKAL